MRTHLVALACAIGLAACGRTVTLTDDFDLTWDFQLTPFLATGNARCRGMMIELLV